jgi:hypothetical protein
VVTVTVTATIVTRADRQQFEVAVLFPVTSLSRHSADVGVVQVAEATRASLMEERTAMLDESYSFNRQFSKARS